MADFQPIQQPDPLKSAQHLRDAADETALFNNLPQLNHRPFEVIQEAIRDLTATVRTVLSEMTALRADFVTLRNELRNEVTAIRAEVVTLRQDMRDGFTTLQASIESTDHNARARLENSRVSSQSQPLASLRTTENLVPPNFPTTSEDINSITSRNLEPLLDAYGIPYRHEDEVRIKRRLFKNFIGIVDV